MTMLDSHVLTPLPGLPEPHGLDLPPAVAIQVKFIRGGAMLNLSIHPSIPASWTLQASCSSRSFSRSPWKGAGSPRRTFAGGTWIAPDFVPLIPRREQIKDHTHLRWPPGYVPRHQASACVWCYFKMPLTAFSRLKELASADKKEEAGGIRGTLISDDDIGRRPAQCLLLEAWDGGATGPWLASV